MHFGAYLVWQTPSQGGTSLEEAERLEKKETDLSLTFFLFLFSHLKAAYMPSHTRQHGRWELSYHHPPCPSFLAQNWLDTPTRSSEKFPQAGHSKADLLSRGIWAPGEGLHAFAIFVTSDPPVAAACLLLHGRWEEKAKTLPY